VIDSQILRAEINERALPTDSKYFERVLYIYSVDVARRTSVWMREMWAAAVEESEGPID